MKTAILILLVVVCFGSVAFATDAETSGLVGTILMNSTTNQRSAGPIGTDMSKLEQAWFAPDVSCFAPFQSHKVYFETDGGGNDEFLDTFRAAMSASSMGRKVRLIDQGKPGKGSLVIKISRTVVTGTDQYGGRDSDSDFCYQTLRRGAYSTRSSSSSSSDTDVTRTKVKLQIKVTFKNEEGEDEVAFYLTGRPAQSRGTQTFHQEQKSDTSHYNSNRNRGRRYGGNSSSTRRSSSQEYYRADPAYARDGMIEDMDRDFAYEKKCRFYSEYLLWLQRCSVEQGDKTKTEVGGGITYTVTQ